MRPKAIKSIRRPFLEQSKVMVPWGQEKRPRKICGNVTAADRDVPPSQRKSLGVFWWGEGREATSLLPDSGLGAEPAGEVLAHFPMETILLG